MPSTWTTPRRVVSSLSALIVVSAAAACGGTSSSGGGAPTTQSTGTTDATEPASRFLERYVTADGAVVRRDQGGDVVSEGQAYGMLIAQEAGETSVVDRIWRWTRSHLERRDGLLAFHADSTGHVLDDQAAADADTLAAYALLRAEGPEADSLRSDGRRLAAAVLDQETFRDDRGRTVLAAGPWAVDSQVVNPSYWMPTVFTALAHDTGDHRWQELADTSVDMVDELTDGGTTLPSDWARVSGRKVVPTGQGGAGGTPQYGPDAQRVPLWLAATCDPRAEHLVADWWNVLQQGDRSAALALATSGEPVDGSSSTVALLASAAAARAGGDTTGARRLLTGAARSEQGSPTYYGGAWLALDHLLGATELSGC